MKNKTHHHPGIRTLLLSTNLSIIGVILIVVLIFFGALYKIIYDMQYRIQQYIQISQLSQEIKRAENQFIQFFTECTDLNANLESSNRKPTFEETEEMSELWKMSYIARVQTKDIALKLESTYEKSPQRYFLNRAIRNGLEYIDIINNQYFRKSFYLTTDSYKNYYQSLKIFSYLENYASTQYLTAAVKSDISALVQNMYNTEIFKNSACACFLIIIICSIILMLKITTKLNVNIQEILYETESITHSHFSTEDLPLKGPRELIHLRKKINLMKKSIRERLFLENKIYRQELEHEKILHELERTRYRALQAQINPHFLFNALNVTSNTALFENALQTVKLINSLASLFRYSLEFKNETSIIEELNFVQKYLEIQKARFGERILFSINCEKDLENVKIPPFIIEPLVENAVIHGIEPKEDGGKIEISVKSVQSIKNDTLVHIEIEDDGIGIPKDFKVQENESDSDCKKTRIGLENVINRLKMTYPKSEINFKRISEQGGTLVTVEFYKNKND